MKHIPLTRESWTALWAEIERLKKGDLMTFAIQCDAIKARWMKAGLPQAAASNARYVVYIEELFRAGIAVPEGLVRAVTPDEIVFDWPNYRHLRAAWRELGIAEPESWEVTAHRCGRPEWLCPK